MPLTATRLYKGANLSPDHFGELIDFQGTPEEQEAQVIAYVQENILSGSNSEISVPVREYLKDFDSELDNAGILAKFGAVSGAEIIALWDFAQLAYGRSELNKLVSSNSEEYDKDSDQDRIQGNQRLQKLLGFIETYLKAKGTTDSGTTIPGAGFQRVGTSSVRINNTM